MTVKNFRKIKTFTAFFLAVFFSIAISQGMPFLSFLALGSAVFVLSLLKTRVDGVLEDERQLQVAGKAAQLAFQVLLPVLMLTSIALLTGKQEDQSFYITALGVVLSYVTSLGLLLYIFAYFIFDRKSRGQ